ncbi:hypothetical protein D9611_009876 [Ephemerocybe angulata]|uniref:Septin-type G domain-containing protein n=1 Tax=Ephemerocybe angulata TaxID=980116 RepID=A0A8H5CD76_9AGAR|nr:hypothetical protein D9611_009876 [Tulosesus angulatus]
MPRPKPYDIMSQKWVKEDDVYMPRKESRSDDIIIPFVLSILVFLLSHFVYLRVMGPTGVGKSTLINNCLDALGSADGRAPTSTAYAASTSKVAHYTATLPAEYSNRRLVLVDTPGFDHYSLDNTEILRRISVWLASSYGDGMKVSGVVYIQSISPDRMKSSHAFALDVFQAMCGMEVLSGVVFATTWWGTCELNEEEGRESELRDNYWKDLLPPAQMIRLYNTPESALLLVRRVLDRPNANPMRLQKQLVENRATVAKTDAGKVLRPEMTLTGAFANFLSKFLK